MAKTIEKDKFFFNNRRQVGGRMDKQEQLYEGD
jgi:hypothetical protein